MGERVYLGSQFKGLCGWSQCASVKKADSDKYDKYWSSDHLFFILSVSSAFEQMGCCPQPSYSINPFLIIPPQACPKACPLRNSRYSQVNSQYKPSQSPNMSNIPRTGQIARIENPLYTICVSEAEIPTMIFVRHLAQARNNPFPGSL